MSHTSAWRLTSPLRYEVTVDMLDARGKRQTPQRYVLDLEHHSSGGSAWKNTRPTTSTGLTLWS